MLAGGAIVAGVLWRRLSDMKKKVSVMEKAANGALGKEITFGSTSLDQNV